MNYLEIIPSSIAAAAALVICLFSLLRKSRSAASITLSAAALTSAALFILMAVNFADHSLLGASAARKAHLSLLIILATLFIFFIISYPYPKPWRPAIAAAVSLPAYALAAVILMTDYVVSPTGAVGTTADGGYALYLAALSFYLFAAPSIAAYKSLLFEYRALKIDLRYISIGMYLIFSIFAALSIYLPHFLGFDRFSFAGTIIPLPLALVFLSYAAGDVTKTDVKRFTATALYWLIVFTILIVPVSLVLKYNNVLYVKDPLPIPGIALFIFAYLFLIFKYFRPRLENAFQRGYRDLVSRADLLFGRQFAAGPGEKMPWEEFQIILVDGLAEQYGISGAYLYLYDLRENRFILAHGSDDRITDSEIHGTGPLAGLLNRSREIIYRHAFMLTSRNPEHSEGIHEILDFFDRNHIEIILPFYSQEKRVIGLLALGRLLDKSVYSRRLISVLDLYRIQFEQHLANAMVLEEARATQVLDHDRMVVSAIKKKIIPQKLAHATGYRISSLYLDNSPHGGDYFDSITLGDREMLLFIADSSYSGVDSALVLLELYTVLHTPGKKIHSPDAMLDTMNWVIATSRFPKKHAPAYCAALASSGELSYSCAGSNPLTVFSQDSGAFIACDTPGAPLGVDRAAKYELRTARLAPGNIGLLYSNGLLSAVNPDGENYGLERLRELIRTGRGRSPADLTRLVYEDLNRFTDGKRQAGDISLIIFKLQ